MEAVVKPNDLSQPSAGFVSFTYSCRMSATTQTVARDLGSGRRYFCWAFRMLQIHCLEKKSNRKLQVPHAGGRVRVVDQLYLRYMPRARDTDEGVMNPCNGMVSAPVPTIPGNHGRYRHIHLGACVLVHHV